jgi:hypothetical protein
VSYAEEKTNLNELIARFEVLSVEHKQLMDERAKKDAIRKVRFDCVLFD